MGLDVLAEEDRSLHEVDQGAHRKSDGPVLKFGNLADRQLCQFVFGPEPIINFMPRPAAPVAIEFVRSVSDFIRSGS